MLETVWYKKIENRIMEQSERLHKKDFRFYHVDTLLQIAKKIDEFSDNCQTCKHLKPNIEEISENLYEYLKGDVSSRKSYETKFEELNSHIRKVHQIYPKQFNLSLYSFIGVVAGLLIGWLMAISIDETYLKQGLILGFTFGLIIGRVYGKLKDSKIRKENRFLE